MEILPSKNSVCDSSCKSIEIRMDVDDSSEMDLPHVIKAVGALPKDKALGRLPRELTNDLVTPSSAPFLSNRLATPFNEIDSLLQTRSLESLNRKNNLEELERPPRYPQIPTSNYEYDPADVMTQRQHDIHRSSSQLIDEHLQEIQVRINGHSQAALRYEKRDRIIGYPVTLLSSFVASTLMMNLSADNNRNQTVVDIIGFSFSVISFVLSLSRDYLKYTTKFQAHDISSKLYTNLLRSIEVRLIGNHITIDDKRDMFKDIVDQMSIIEQYELPIPSNINKSIRADVFLPRSFVINHALNNESKR
jgi:hypothetical protein